MEKVTHYCDWCGREMDGQELGWCKHIKLSFDVRTFNGDVEEEVDVCNECLDANVATASSLARQKASSR